MERERERVFEPCILPDPSGEVKAQIAATRSLSTTATARYSSQNCSQGLLQSSNLNVS